MSVKKRKLASLFFKLPHEIIISLISNLNKSDIISLGSTSREYQEFLKPYIYDVITLGWKDLLELEKKKLDVSNIKSYVETIRILEYDIRKEWNYNYVTLCDQFHNLKKLQMQISNSSNFLKYLSNDMNNIQELELKSISEESNLFNIDHLQKFTNLHKLKLTGFLIDFEDEDYKIENLELANCYWSFPFNLELFCGVLKLTLNYTNQFVLSERFRYFILNPTLQKLEFLHIKNLNPKLKVHITGKNLIEITTKLPSLRRIQLDGNIETSPIPYGGISNVKVLSSIHDI